MEGAWVGTMRRMSLAVAVAVGLAIGAPTAASALAPGDLVVSDLSAFGDGHGGLIGVSPAGTRSTVSENAAPTGAPNLVGPGPAVFDADGDLVVTDWRGDALLRVDPDTGVRTTISSNSVGSGPSLDLPWGLAIEPGGDILVVNSSSASVVRVNPATGDRTYVSGGGVGTGPLLNTPWGIAIEADGDLLVVDEFAPDSEGGVIRVDPDTGDRTAVSSNAIGTGPDYDDPFSIALEADGNILVANYIGAGPERSVLRVDPVSGDRETVTSNSVGDGPGIGIIGGITVAPGGDILLANIDGGDDAAESSGVLRVDPESGDRTTVSDNLTPAGEPAFAEPGAIAIVPAEVTPPYAAVVLADGPAGYWRFGEMTGTTAIDSSPNANDGTYLNNPLHGVAGALAADPNTAVRFDGVNDYVRVLDDNSLDVGNTFTAEAWMKRSSTTKAHELMVKGFQLTIMNAANGNQIWLRKPNVTTVARSATGVPADGAYHHIVVTKQGSGTGAVKMYIDGAAVAVVDVSPAQVIGNTALSLSFAAAGSTPADYDDFAIYPTALSAARVLAHYTAGHPSI